MGISITIKYPQYEADPSLQLIQRNMWSLSTSVQICLHAVA